jgi:UDP-2-acetamido-3-amino-2,3-dideoxy-glucuronate N-acetyltransferase
MGRTTRVHRTAEVAPTAVVGEGTSVWNNAQVREGAHVGRECILAHGVYVDANVHVGDRVKLENNVSVFLGARVEDGVFIGPHTCLLNDRNPRSTAPSGELKREEDWEVSGVVIEEGASVGGGCVLLPGVRIGRYALVGAGAVVTRDVPAHGLVVGNPARLVGHVCECGARLDTEGTCTTCTQTHQINEGMVSNGSHGNTARAAGARP